MFCPCKICDGKKIGVSNKIVKKHISLFGINSTYGFDVSGASTSCNFPKESASVGGVHNKDKFVGVDSDNPPASRFVAGVDTDPDDNIDDNDDVDDFQFGDVESVIIDDEVEDEVVVSVDKLTLQQNPKEQLGYGTQERYWLPPTESTMYKPLYKDSKHSLLDALAAEFLWFSSTPSVSKASVTSQLKLKKSIVPSPNTYPHTYTEAINLIKPYLSSAVEYDMCPDDCIVFTKEHKFYRKCPMCSKDRYKTNGNAARRFLYMPIKDRIVRIFGDANLSKELQKDTVARSEDDMIRDLHDSKAWDQYRESGRKVSLVFNTDGVNPFSLKSAYSMWPMLLAIENWRREVRFKFQRLLMVGIIPSWGNGQESRNIQSFMKIVADEVFDINGSPIYDAYRCEWFPLSIDIRSYVFDYPAVNKVFNVSGSGAYSGCAWCECIGYRCANSQKMVYLGFRRYLNTDHPLRTDPTFLSPCAISSPKAMNQPSYDGYRVAFEGCTEQHKKLLKEATGYKGPSAFMDLKGFDIQKQVSPDPMHTITNVFKHVVHLIVGRYSIKLESLLLDERAWKVENQDISTILGNLEASNDKEKGQKKRRKTSKRIDANVPFILTKDKTKVADSRIRTLLKSKNMKIKCCGIFTKDPMMNSHDWLELLKSGVFVESIEGLLPEPQNRTICQFLNAITMLLQDELHSSSPKNVLEEVKESLAYLERDFPIAILDISFHLLLHIAESLALEGPVHSRWMFPFERFNSFITRRVMSRSNPERCVMETYQVYDWVQFLSTAGMIAEDLVNPSWSN